MPLQHKMMCDSNTFDVVIIGGGPSSLSASIYIAAAGYKVAYIEKNVPGGKLVNIVHNITNYPGFKSISGPDLALQMYEQAQQSGAISLFGEVSQIDQYLNYHVVYTTDGATRYAKALIIATGMNENKLIAKDADKYENKGISYCAMCDGGLAKDRDVIVFGNGDSALDNAIYLSKICKHIYLVVKYDKLNLQHSDINVLKQANNIEIIYNSTIDTVLGDGNKVTGAIIKDVNTNEQKKINCSCIFNFTGLNPATDFIKNTKLLDDKHFIIHNQKMETSIPGIYAIGDVCNNQFKQIPTAVNDGSVAGLNIIQYLKSWK